MSCVAAALVDAAGKLDCPAVMDAVRSDPRAIDTIVDCHGNTALGRFTMARFNMLRAEATILAIHSVVCFLLKHGAKQISNHKGECACMCTRLPIMQRTLINHDDHTTGDTPLSWAAEYGSLDLFRCFLPFVEWEELSLALALVCQRGDVAKVEEVFKWTQERYHEFSPLTHNLQIALLAYPHAASSPGVHPDQRAAKCVEVIKVFGKFSALVDIGMHDKQGRTSMQLGVLMGRVEILEALVEAGASAVALSANGISIVDMLALFKPETAACRMLHFLLRKGHLPASMLEPHVYTSITMAAIEDGNYETAQLLARAGSRLLDGEVKRLATQGERQLSFLAHAYPFTEVHAQQHSSNILHLAAMSNTDAAANLLRRCLESPTITSIAQAPPMVIHLSPLCIASKTGNYKGVAVLLESAEVRARINCEPTLLYALETLPGIKVAHLLLDHGANPLAQLYSGRTVLERAQRMYGSRGEYKKILGRMKVRVHECMSA